MAVPVAATAVVGAPEAAGGGDSVDTIGASGAGDDDSAETSAAADAATVAAAADLANAAKIVLGAAPLTLEVAPASTNGCTSSATDDKNPFKLSQVLGSNLMVPSTTN